MLRRPCSLTAHATCAPVAAAVSSVGKGYDRTWSSVNGPARAACAIAEDDSATRPNAVAKMVLRMRLLLLIRPEVQREMLPAVSRPSRPASCVSYLLSASRATCACG